MKQDMQENNEMVITVEQDLIGPPGDVFIYEGSGLTTISCIPIKNTMGFIGSTSTIG